MNISKRDHPHSSFTFNDVKINSEGNIFQLSNGQILRNRLTLTLRSLPLCPEWNWDFFQKFQV